MLQSEALDILKMGKNVFLTGQAGSGKTFVLNAYISFLRSRGAHVAVTASTGIAATHLGGMTIHSWSGIGIRDSVSKGDARRIAGKRNISRRLKNTDVLVIDEISMLGKNVLDAVDAVCRAGKNRPNESFGGIQVVLCGDFFQLPPVQGNKQVQATNDRGSVLFSDEETLPFAYNARAFWEGDFAVCYLHEQHRQEDDRLVSILNTIRSGEAEKDLLGELIALHKESPRKSSDLRGDSFDVDEMTHLYTHNADVDGMNARRLDAISGKARGYRMRLGGNARAAEAMRRACLAPEHLVLKVGAAVMFVRNNFEAGYVNGTLGVVTGFTGEGFPKVKTRSGRTISARPEEWVLEEYDREIAQIKQVPLRLAWAITVHKSQGMTLDAAKMDLSKSFVPGMGYVALSRVRSLLGLHLLGINETALAVHPEILDRDNDFLEKSRCACEELQEMNTSQKEQLQRTFLDHVSSGKRNEKKLSTQEKTKQLLQKKYFLKEIVTRRAMTEGTILNHIETMMETSALAISDIEYLAMHISDDRMKTIHEAFKKTKQMNLSPVKELLGEEYSYDEIRLSRLFLADKKK